MLRIEVEKDGDKATVKVDDMEFDLYKEDGIWILVGESVKPHAFKKRDDRKALLYAIEKALEIVTGK